MMKPRSSRVVADQATSGARLSKSEPPSANGTANATRNQAQLNSNQPTSAQNIRKRRSSINVYDQPSSLNSRLRQLETDMLRLDEDRTKLFDDTHSALAQYELKLSEIHAILKSRQDNVEKYVEDMKMLLQAKEEFERQTKLLNEKHERIHEKFMHRETTISREIKLLKNKFELLEKNRQFRSILQKSSNTSSGGIGGANVSQTSDDLASGLDSNEFQKAGGGSEADSFSTDCRGTSSSGITASNLNKSNILSRSPKSVRIKLSKFDWLTRPFRKIFGRSSEARRRRNRVSSLANFGTQQQMLAPDDQRVVYELNETGSGDDNKPAKETLISDGGDMKTSLAIVTDAPKSNQMEKSKRRSLVGRLLNKKP